MKKQTLFAFVCLAALFTPVWAQQTPDAFADNATLSTIQTRTSIRKFTEDTVPQACVERLLRAGMAAPTAMNRQPWHFVVVTRASLLEEMGGRAQEAPLAIVVCGNLDRTIEGRGRDYWVQDCSAASENILLAAHALGLGAVWTGAYPGERSEKYQKLLSLPENLVPLNVIAIGFPDEAPTPKDKWDEHKVTYIQ